MSFIGGPLPQYEINRRRNRPNYGENDGNLFSDFLNRFKKKEKPEDPRSEIEKITGKTFEEILKMQRDRENQSKANDKHWKFVLAKEEVFWKLYDSNKKSNDFVLFCEID